MSLPSNMPVLANYSLADLANLIEMGIDVHFKNGQVVKLTKRKERSPNAQRQAEYRDRKRNKVTLVTHNSNPELPLSPSSNGSPDLSFPSPPKPPSSTLPAQAAPAPKPQPKKTPTPADPRFRPFTEAFCESYQLHTGNKYPFTEADGSQLKSLLGKLPDLTVEHFRKGLDWCRQKASEDQYANGCVKTTGSLMRFCSAWGHIEDYANIPQPPPRRR